ncbi:MAG: HD domain-containing protein [Desulfurococcaceae archaeon]
MDDYKTVFTWKMISDPLYGYVYFNTQVEEALINNVLLQRLRYIMQLQTAHYVYPGAVHTRFQHSAGVMHLSGLMAEDMLNKLISLHGKEVLEGYEPASVIEATRLAGLLHDVGHAAFSHAFEQGLLWRRDLPLDLSNHERIGFKLISIILDEYLDNVETKYFPGLKEILHGILGFREPKGLVKVFRWIVREGYYPADVIDFLRRDSYYAGTVEYGSILYERLYKNTYPLIDGKKISIVLDRIAFGEFKQYMYAKTSMYEHVYYHSVCRSFDRILYDILEQLDGELDLTGRVTAINRGDVRGYLELTDVYLYSVMMNKALYDTTRLGYLCNRIMISRKPEWKRVGRDVSISAMRGLREIETSLKLILDPDYRGKVSKGLLDSLISALRSRNIDESEIWVDLLDIAPLPKSTIYPGSEVYNSNLLMYIGKKIGGNIVVSEEFNPFIEDLPLKVIFRVYVKREKYTPELEPIISSTIVEYVQSILGVETSDIRKLIEDIYSKYKEREYSKFKLTA